MVHVQSPIAYEPQCINPCGATGQNSRSVPVVVVHLGSSSDMQLPVITSTTSTRELCKASVRVSLLTVHAVRKKSEPGSPKIASASDRKMGPFSGPKSSVPNSVFRNRGVHFWTPFSGSTVSHFFRHGRRPNRAPASPSGSVGAGTLGQSLKRVPVFMSGDLE